MKNIINKKEKKLKFDMRKFSVSLVGFMLFVPSINKINAETFTPEKMELTVEKKTVQLMSVTHFVEKNNETNILKDEVIAEDFQNKEDQIVIKGITYLYVETVTEDNVRTYYYRKVIIRTSIPQTGDTETTGSLVAIVVGIISILIMKRKNKLICE